MKKHSIIMMLISIVVMDILSGMEFNLFVPSFAELQNHFHVSSFWIEALLSVNFFGYCLSLFFVGTLADYYGRKPIIVYGLFVFIVGTIICLFSGNFALLLLGRFLQGIGIAAPAILSFLIIADRYPIEKQQSLFAMLNGALNIAAGAAPVLGSYIALYFKWRGNFIALLLLAIASLVMTIMFIEKDKFTAAPKQLSFGGYKHLLQSKTLLLLLLCIILMMTPYWVFVGMSPLLFIKSLHVSLHYFGFYQGILAFTFALGSIGFGLIINYYRTRTWLTVSLWIYALSFIMMVCVAVFYNHNPLLITLSMLIFVIGQIIPGAILYPLCLNFIPEAKAKIAGLLQVGRLLFSALALQITGYLYHGSFSDTGAIIALFIFMIIVTQILVMKNKQIFKR